MPTLYTIKPHQLLVMTIQWEDGSAYSAEMRANEGYTDEDIRKLITDETRERSYVSGIYRVDLALGTCEDITSDFDCPTWKEVQERTYDDREREFERAVSFQAWQRRHYGTEQVRGGSVL